MKKIIITTFILSLLIITYAFTQTKPLYNNGDIVLQTTNGETGKAIQLATHSKFNHCGVLFFENNEWVVYEAVQPVGKISLLDFNKRGKATIMRLKNASTILTTEAIQKLKNIYKEFDHKNYDSKYNWSNDELYCSELVYKLYFNGLGVELCKPRHLKDFDLSNPLVKKQLDLKYNNHIPLNEPMVAPSDIETSSLLQLVN